MFIWLLICYCFMDSSILQYLLINQYTCDERSYYEIRSSTDYISYIYYSPRCLNVNHESSITSSFFCFINKQMEIKSIILRIEVGYILDNCINKFLPRVIIGSKNNISSLNMIVKSYWIEDEILSRFRIFFPWLWSNYLLKDWE